jgi:hypothetical protein
MDRVMGRDLPQALQKIIFLRASDELHSDERLARVTVGQQAN